MKLSRRRFERKYPAPPPTPPGMVYAKQYGLLVPVPEKALSDYCRREMEMFDRLSPEAREAIRNARDNITSDDLRKAAEKAEANAKTASVGFGRAF